MKAKCFSHAMACRHSIYRNARELFLYCRESNARSNRTCSIYYCYSYAYVLLRGDPSRSENLAQDRPNEPATFVFLGFQSIIGTYHSELKRGGKGEFWDNSLLASKAKINDFFWNFFDWSGHEGTCGVMKKIHKTEIFAQTHLKLHFKLHF